MSSPSEPEKQNLTGKKSEQEDKFVAMVSAVAEVNLPISQFVPKTMLVTPEHVIESPKYPVIDYHNHLDAKDPYETLKIMDACRVERLVNITMKTGDDALEMIKRFHSASPDRFSTIGWMDWSGVESPEFPTLAVERLEKLVEHGACGIKLWKDLGLQIRDASGNILRVDDERLDPVFEKAAELRIPVMFHTADPAAFFLPIDRYNERYEELAAHPDWAFSTSVYSKRELLEQRNNVFARHPKTVFVGAHVGESGEDLAFIGEALERYPNLYVDISARTPELGRQPYRAREFFLRFPDRIVFGTDLLPEIEMYRLYYRFLETADEYFDYPSHASRQGRWKIYGIFLPDDVLEKVYRKNALRLLSLK